MHLMYVDESGDPGIPLAGSAAPRGGPTRFFVRAGLVVHDRKWFRVDTMVANFKRTHGLAWDSEIKATELRAGKGSFAGWDPQKREQFLLDLLYAVAREDCLSILAVAIDKTQVDHLHRMRYSNPSVRSLELLLERFNEFLLDQKDHCGITILDAIESKNDANLRYFQNYLRRFSEHVDPQRIVEGTLFLPSHTSNLLQLADVCTNVVYRRYSRDDGNAAEYAQIQDRVWVEKKWPT